jgi:hypothetical protein
MKRRPPHDRLLPMTTPPTTLTVRLDSIDEPIAGLVGAQDGSSQAFTGWLELASALERAMRGAATTPQTSHREAR